MPRSAKVLIAIALFAGCAVAFFVRAPTPLSQLISVAAALVLLLVLPVGVFHAWRHRARGLVRATLPLVACLLAVPIGSAIGRGYRDFDFRYRRLPAYEEVVRRIQSAELPGWQIKEIPPEIDGLAYMIEVHDDAPGGLMVEFFWGGGFPVKHSVYMYQASGLPPPTSPNWEFKPYCQWDGARRLDENWFADID